MLTSISLKKPIFRFWVLYCALVAVTAVGIYSIYLGYFSYVSSVVQSVSHNSIMINDLHSLKQNLTPLIKGDIRRITVSSSHGDLLYDHALEEKKTIYTYSAEYEIYQNNNLLYTVIIHIDLGRPFIIFLGLLFAYLFLLIPFKKFEQKQLINYANSTIANLAKKLAHDIRSPISTLNLLSEKFDNQEYKDLQQAVTSQINKISEDLLVLHRKPEASLVGTFQTNNIEVIHLLTYKEFLNNLKREYQLKRNTLLRNFSFSFPNELDAIIMRNEKIIYPILCNLIQNAVEATTDYTGTIAIEASVSNNLITIEITDNGKGIPESILNRLGKDQITYGKESTNSGNGIALLNCSRDLAQLGGNLEIKSEINKFTAIKVQVPV